MFFSVLDWSQGRPRFFFDDFAARRRRLMSPLGKTFTIERLPTRHCTGYYDLDTFETHPCPFGSSLPLDAKSNQCDSCKIKSGFNPAFYNTENIAPQQQRYNEQPHSVYLAWFAPKVVKVGISSVRREHTRLCEQGARYAVIVAQFDNAYLARELESKLSEKEDVIERVALGSKLKLFANCQFSLDQARMDIETILSKYQLATVREYPIQDQFFFLDCAFSRAPVSIPQNTGEFISGRCVGMIGSIALMEQNETLYLVPVQSFKSHDVFLTPGKVLRKYVSEKKQLSLF